MKFQKIQELVKVFTRLSKRERNILYGACLFVLVALLDRLVLGPATSKIAVLNKEIQEKQLFMKKDARIVAEKEKMLAEKAKFSAFFSAAKSQEEQITLILKEIESLASQCSVYIIDMKPASSKKADFSEKYYINLSCEAKMSGLVSFMYNIENSAELLTIEKYSLSPKSGETNLAMVNMLISKIVVRKFKD